MRLVTCSFLCFSLALNSAAFAQNQLSGTIKGKPWTGARGVTQSVSEIKALSQRPQEFREESRAEQEGAMFSVRRGLHQNPLSQYISRLPGISKNAREPAGSVPLNPQSIGVDFRSQHGGHLYPPDCAGAVGPTQILVCTNDTIKTFNRSGSNDGALGLLSTSAFFNSVSDAIDTAAVSDPHVVFDRLSQRWFIVMANYYQSERSNRILIAVSSGATITSKTDFTFYEFRQDSVGGLPNSDQGALLDYPTLGVDANALYIGGDMFLVSQSGGKFLGSTVFVVRKSSVMSGGPIVVTAFRRLCADTLHGPFAPQGATNDDSTATEGYIAGVDALSYGLVQIRRITDPGGTPGISGNLSVNVPATYTPSNVPAKGSSYPLNGLDDRLSATYIRNGSLWTSHAIAVNSIGIADTSGSGRNAVCYYEIKDLTSSPTLNQSGLLYSGATTSPPYFWNPSIAVSGQGHAAIGCTFAGANDYAGIAYSGRLAGDSPGSLETPVFFPSSHAYNPYNPFPLHYVRWGDFSTTSVDPTDNMTIWTIQEYCDSTGAGVSHGVRVTELKAPPPPSLLSVSPDSIGRGASHINVVITGASGTGAGFYDPGAAFPKRISALINGGGVTVNGITVTDPTHITLNVTVDTSAPLGGRSITVVNPDSQSVSSAPAFIAVTQQSVETIRFPLSSSWNLISNPLSVADDSSTALFPDAISPAFAYNPGSGYQVSPELKNGAGYWLRFNSSGISSITGNQIGVDSIPVSDGWNLIGSVDQPVPAAAIASIPPGMITSKFFAYAGGYVVTDTIKPGEGCWVKVSGSGVLILSSQVQSAAQRIRIVASDETPPAPPETGSGVIQRGPAEYSLQAAYPNPFNPTTTIRYGLPALSRVRLRVYNALGQDVATLRDDIEDAGYREVAWDAARFASGVYFYRLDAVSVRDPGQSYTNVKKVMLVR